MRDAYQICRIQHNTSEDSKSPFRDRTKIKIPCPCTAASSNHGSLRRRHDDITTGWRPCLCPRQHGVGILKCTCRTEAQELLWPTMSTHFRMALRRMMGDDPDLELSPNYMSRWSFASSSISRTNTTDDAVSVAPFVPSRNEEEAVDNGERDNAQCVSGFNLYTLVIGLMMAAFLLMIDSTILVTVGKSKSSSSAPKLIFQAIPSITSTFDSLKDIGWYGSTYLLAT